MAHPVLIWFFSADDGIIFQEKKSSLSYKLRKEMKKEKKEKRREEKEKQRQAEGKDKFRDKDKNGGTTLSELVGWLVQFWECGHLRTWLIPSADSLVLVLSYLALIYMT